MIIDNIIFDLDGTLIDSSVDIIDCLEKAYDTITYIPPSIEKSLIGRTLTEIICTLTPDITDSERKLVHNTFRRFYDEGEHLNTTLYEGTLETLQNLKKQNISLFIATNKPYEAAHKIINLKKINTYFKDTITYDFFINHKMGKTEIIEFIINSWQLNPSNTIMIGDSVSDLIGAENNNIPSIAALYGYGKEKDLLNCKPLTTIKSISILPKILLELTEDKT